MYEIPAYCGAIFLLLGQTEQFYSILRSHSLNLEMPQQYLQIVGTSLFFVSGLAGDQVAVAAFSAVSWMLTCATLASYYHVKMSSACRDGRGEDELESPTISTIIDSTTQWQYME